VNAVGTTSSNDHVFHTPDPPRVGYEYASRTPSSVQLFTTINAEGQATTYRFRWGTRWPLDHSTATRSGGSAFGGVRRTGTLGGLEPGTTYHWDVVATNAAGTTSSPGESFVTR
jgi:hypothetical protein